MRAFATVLLVLLLAAAPAGASITGAADDARTGWYPDQGTLTPQLVSGGTFGRLWSAPVSGQVYAQPLVDGQKVLVATEANQAYALDAKTGALRWQHDLGVAWNTGDL